MVTSWWQLDDRCYDNSCKAKAVITAAKTKQWHQLLGWRFDDNWKGDALMTVARLTTWQLPGKFNDSFVHSILLSLSEVRGVCKKTMPRLSQLLRVNKSAMYKCCQRHKNETTAAVSRCCSSFMAENVTAQELNSVNFWREVIHAERLCLWQLKCLKHETKISQLQGPQ
jgi:hypothetical protein